MLNRRLHIMTVFFMVACGVLALGQLRISVLKAGEYSRCAASQRKSTIEIKNRRGKFYDRNMIPLVESTVESVSIGTGTNTANRVTIPVRYGEASPACHLIGYTDGEGRGAAGLEKTMDSYIAAPIYDRVNVVTGADGNVIGDAGMTYVAGGGEGNSVVLTLDYHIQKICEEALKARGGAGAVAVIDTRSFDLVAMASAPSYSQSNIEAYINATGGEFINRCTAPYNAGSIFKIVTFCSALENRKLKEEYFCEGSVTLDGHTFKCHKEEGHGKVNSSRALAVSCNCAFYDIGRRLGSAGILATARDFGFGNTVVCCTGFDEHKGNIPLKKRYRTLDGVNYAIGQGEVLVTPVQAANMVAIIANCGVARKVNAADRVVDSKGRTVRIMREAGQWQVVSADTAHKAGEAMRLGVTEGTAEILKNNPARIAGKTGTAETGWQKGGRNLVHGWFCGYFPYGNPHYAMAVLIEDGGSGAASAAPLFGRIAEEIIKIYPIG